jgi:hypothetical protein
MAPTKKTTSPTSNNTAPTQAPNQARPQTALGRVGRTEATFQPNPPLAPKPKDNGSVLIADPSQRHPAPTGPAAPGSGGTPR